MHERFRQPQSLDRLTLAASFEIGSTRIAVRFILASKLQRILAARFAIVSREQFGPSRTVFD